MVTHLFSTALNGSVSWLWSVTTLTEVRAWESKIMRLAFSMKTDATNVTRWKHKFRFHKRGVRWDTPTATWAEEEND